MSVWSLSLDRHHQNLFRVFTYISFTLLALIERSIEVERFPAELKQHSRPLLSFKPRKILNLWPATSHRKIYLRIGSDCKAGFPKKLPDTGGLKILKLSTNAQTMFLGNLQAELRLGYGRTSLEKLPSTVTAKHLRQMWTFMVASNYYHDNIFNN